MSHLELIEIPVFPLPNVVFFPETRLPLHVFEPRYRQMVQDALSSEHRLIGMALLKPGWQSDHEGSPHFHPIGGAGELESCTPLDEGKFEIVLRGAFRFRIEEFIRDSPYRLARAVKLPEIAVDEEDADVEREKEELLWLFKRFLAELSSGGPPEWNPEAFSYAALVNGCSSAVELHPERKQALLEMNSLRYRRDSIAKIIGERLAAIDFLRPYRPRRGDTDNN